MSAFFPRCRSPSGAAGCFSSGAGVNRIQSLRPSLTAAHHRQNSGLDRRWQLWPCLDYSRQLRADCVCRRTNCAGFCAASVANPRFSRGIREMFGPSFGHFHPSGLADLSPLFLAPRLGGSIVLAIPACSPACSPLSCEIPRPAHGPPECGGRPGLS